jgi:dolichol-phosphate mannosyltransferase
MYEMMLKEGADVVYGQRRTRAGESAFKKHTASAFYRLLLAHDLGRYSPRHRRFSLDDQSASPTRSRKCPSMTASSAGSIAWLGFKQVAFQYDRVRRFAGMTK